MARRGLANNPGGANGATDPQTGTTSVAGLIRRDMNSTGVPAAPGQNAPRQAQRAATSPRPTGAPAQPTVLLAPTPPQPPAPSYEQQLSQVWQQIAQTPGASDLVQQIAAQTNG